jgi:hypothetical protein
MKLFFLRIEDLTRKWTMPIANWSIIRGQLDICRATIESVAVHSEKDVAFTFRDGSEIHVDVRGK